MSKNEKMVQPFCQNSVEYVPVKDLFSVLSAPKKIPRSRYGEGSLYPVIDQGQALVSGYTDDESALVPKGEYVLFGDHTREVKWVNFPFAQGADGLKILIPGKSLVPRYAYHAIKNLHIASRGYNRHWTVLYKMKIPVPPLEIQRKIVRILDSFEKLGAELEAELEARKAQYAYYRDRLLSHESLERMEGAAIESHPLGELGTFTRGRRFTKADYAENGVPSIHYAEIYTQFGTATDKALSFVRNDKAGSLRYAQPGDLIIACTGEDSKDIAKAVAWMGEGPVAVHDDCAIFHHTINPKYVSYYFQTSDFSKLKQRYATEAKMTRISVKRLASFEIPVPTPAVQQQVVDILDRFDALTTSLTDGLPAEIEARRKQSEYYRDRLLDFPRKEA